MPTTSALQGISVVDLSRVLAGPLVAQTLGDLGADVVKIESPEGDDTRRWSPPADAEGRATYHHAANRNKRSVVLDLREPGDGELARRLCERADVVVANFKPGTLERFGIGYDDVASGEPARRVLRDHRLRRGRRAPSCQATTRSSRRSGV